MGAHLQWYGQTMAVGMSDYGHNIAFLGLWSAGHRAQGLLPLPSLRQH